MQGLLVILVLTAVVAFGWFGLTNPWVFTVGGSRYLPLWQGMAKAGGPGGQYRIYLAFYPTGASTSRASTWAKGWGMICAPGGQGYRLHLAASTDSVVWKDMNGKPFHVVLHGSSPATGLNSGKMGPPVIDLRGRWQGDQLVLNDGRTIDTSFNLDGRISEPPKAEGMEKVLTFSETGWVLTNPCE
ncbi:MAG: hypothetical protein ACKOPM_12700 [Novosphingobium sp.]